MGVVLVCRLMLYVALYYSKARQLKIKGVRRSFHTEFSRKYWWFWITFDIKVSMMTEWQHLGKIFKKAMLNLFYKLVRIVYVWKVFNMHCQDVPLFLFVLLIEKYRSLYSHIIGICLLYYFLLLLLFPVEGNHFHHYVHIGITAGLLANHWCSTLSFFPRYSAIITQMSYMATNIFNILPCDSTVQPRLRNMVLENPSM